jgi:hypothetical protein
MESGKNRKGSLRAEQEVAILLSVAPIILDYTSIELTCP